MAPAKRFRDLDLLSGGEKSLAALALLFALHSYQRAPFLILDEVDAALDAHNVRALRRYLKQKADFQCIVISLKEALFTRSDSLVGVYKDRANDTSRTLSLGLNEYRRAAGELEEEIIELCN